MPPLTSDPSSRNDFAGERAEMVRHQLERRGISNELVLAAMRDVPREAFVRSELAEFAYQDAPLPIGEDQTISQPYMVALMAEQLEPAPEERALDVGTGSGYAAAVLSRIFAEVYTIERHEALAASARERFDRLDYENIEVRHGDGSMGWPERAPFDAIEVAAAGPDVPQPLLDQLAVGGRLVAPTGPVSRAQELKRVRRVGEDTYEEEDLGRVRFVPLVGESGWTPSGDGATPEAPPAPPEPETVPERIAVDADRFGDLSTADLDALLARIGDARIVCLGEATHGTSEFYRMRARITRALIEEKGFTVVAAEADWPDAAQVNAYVRSLDRSAVPETAFTRFPTWMWANEEVVEFLDWLREYNVSRARNQQAGFYGLDLYSLYTSIEAVLEYLDEVDPAAAAVARQRYGCLSPWEHDPAAYGRAALTGQYHECADEAVAMLNDLLDKRLQYRGKDGERFLDAVQNARLVADAEAYYRAMYYGSKNSWNLRDQHMFDTLQEVLDVRGGDAKAVVWAHNSHLGNAAATEMGARGQHNVGQLCRDAYGDDAYLIGFGTDRGTVAAASEWGGPMEVKEVRPAHEESYERLCHESEVPSFLLPLRPAHTPELRDALAEERLERAIGVIYRPETELRSHYFQARLPQQFDEYVWFDETEAVTPLTSDAGAGMPDTFPFGV
ncbi:MAG: protein-L-isoaspartate(D-aspartate) O-methyltransferase [Salinivenus sp.]